MTIIGAPTSSAAAESPRRQPTARDRRRRRGILTVVGAAVLFGVLAVLVRLGWAPLQAADSSVAQNINAVVSSHSTVVDILTAITNLGSAGLLIWLVVLTSIVLLVRRRYHLVAYLAVTAAGAIVLDPTLKALIGRLRPVVAHPVAFGRGDSFPSGHALDSLICYGALVLVLLPSYARYRRWVVGIVATLVVLIGLSRIGLGVHFVSDVIGAWCVGTAWLGLTVYAFEIFRTQTGRPVSQPLTEGVEPEAAADVRPTDPVPAADRAAERVDVMRAAAWVVVGWVFVLGAVVGLGRLIQRGGDNILGDTTVPAWLAAHRTPTLDRVSDFWSQAGNTHAIMAVGLVAGAIALGVIRRWRPVVFLVVLMLGELGLFLASAKVVGRERPAVAHLDGPLPTSAYPSGHVAATLCLYAGIALLVLRRTRAWWRWLFLVPAVAMPLLVALARMYRGMHHPTDIVASTMLSAAWITVTYLAIRPGQHSPTPPADDMTGRTGSVEDDRVVRSPSTDRS
jgi:undecaprenyl-diphosphatase